METIEYCKTEGIPCFTTFMNAEKTTYVKWKEIYEDGPGVVSQRRYLNGSIVV